MDEVKREERVARLRSCKATSFEHLEHGRENTNEKGWIMVIWK
jgi:hypothetical protein